MLTKIEGEIDMPDGHEFVRIGRPFVGETIIGSSGSPHLVMADWSSGVCVIIRKIQPKMTLIGQSDLMTDERDAIICIDGRIHYVIDASDTHVATRAAFDNFLRTYEQLREMGATYSMDVGTTWHSFEKPAS